MRDTLPHLINIPPFMFKGVDYKNLNFFSKILFILFGKLNSYVINLTNGKLFCFFINIFYSSQGNLEFQNNVYIFTNKIGRKFNYPNKRVLRVVNKYKITFNKILESYCADSIVFENGDIVIDCGANVGEFNLALKELDINVEYIAFEPDIETFNCLKLNNPNSTVYNVGLSNENSLMKLFIDNDGGNTSFSYFGTEKYVYAESKTLDSYEFRKQIKLLKIDAEGFEPEVLEGAKNTLKNINFISVDYGAERGLNQETTIVDVNNFLYNNDFKLYKFSNHRLVGLYINNKY